MPSILGKKIIDCSSIQKDLSKGDQREIKRREYKPTDIKVLFACESLPKEKENFFYYRHSVLFDRTLEAFQNVFPKITQANFLDRFKEFGFYLDDLCGEPVNHLKSKEERKKRICLRKLYESDFIKRIVLYKPQFIIITPKEITENIISILSMSNLNVPFKELPFPAGSQTNVNNYVNELISVLTELIDKEIIEE
jgi:hypothetical protein